MKILVDVDGVTTDTVKKILTRLNNHFGTNFKHEDITMWGFFGSPKGTNPDSFLNEEQQIFVQNLMAEPGFVRDLELIPHVEEVLLALSKRRCEIVWLTAPWPHSETWIEDRTAMIHEKLGHISKNIVFSWNKEETPGDLLIDDRPEFLVQWLEKNYKGYKWGHQVLLFKQPWNEITGKELNLPFMDGWKDPILAQTIACRVLR